MKPSTWILLVLTIFISSCTIHWEKASDWTLYGFQGSQMFKIPVDSLNSYDTIPMNRDTVIYYLSTATTLKSKASPVWMGGYLASCKINGKLKKVIFSDYGGFFYDEGTRTYYQLAPEMKGGWLEYLHDRLLTLARRKVASAN